jgi:excisionase family DNA binding protein
MEAMLLIKRYIRSSNHVENLSAARDILYVVSSRGYTCTWSIVAADQKEDSVVHEDADLLTVREVARRLRVDDTTVRRWIKLGVLEAITLPHRGSRQAYRIRRSTLESLLAQSPEAVGS